MDINVQQVRRFTSFLATIKSRYSELRIEVECGCDYRSVVAQPVETQIWMDTEMKRVSNLRSSLFALLKVPFCIAFN